MKLLSLYDYLKKPAGSDLGLFIATIALKEKTNVYVKTINNKKYQGEVNMYPKEFLDNVFMRYKNTIQKYSK